MDAKDYEEIRSGKRAATPKEFAAMVGQIGQGERLGLVELMKQMKKRPNDSFSRPGSKD